MSGLRMVKNLQPLARSKALRGLRYGWQAVTPTKYKAAIKTLGLSQERAGDWLGIGRRTSQGYALGEYPVPEPVGLKPEHVR
jgi:hypothetical protein